MAVSLHMKCWMQVVLIASLDANLRQDRQIAGQQINYVSSGLTAAACQERGWEQLEVIMPAHRPDCCCYGKPHSKPN